MKIDNLLAKGLLPDWVIRMGIRRLNRLRLRDERMNYANPEYFNRFLKNLKYSPIAVLTEKANEQHYMVPDDFFHIVLGKHKKYSSCLYQQGNETLDEAEQSMLELYCQRAQLADGMKILDMGCGWGSLSLYLAGKYPKSKITGVSNSTRQREYILKKAKERGIKNLTILTADMNKFSLSTRFDRIISIEMFEHMRNYQLLLKKVSAMLSSKGKLFVHIFTHNRYSYFFEPKDETDWMSRYFFSGGIMPSQSLLHFFQDHLKLAAQWEVNGVHYAKTSGHWLERMDNNKEKLMPIFEKHYGKEARTWFSYWRVFFMAVEELFNTSKGGEWQVTHYLFEKP